MAFINPSVADFKAQFIRDFPYGTDVQTSILDQDIINAYKQVNANINQGLGWIDQAEYTLGYLYLAAHYLVSAIQASSQGLSGQYNFLQQSKGVAGVSEGFSIPQRFVDRGNLGIYCKTHYGLFYADLIYPKMIAPMMSVRGETKP
jgi:hypothetical protein